MLDSMGPVVPRENENLGAGDEGINMLRQIYFDSIESVKRGEDPKGTIRDEAKNRMIVVESDYGWISEQQFKAL